MKILIIGATGTIGKAVVEAFEGRHDIIQAGYSHGDIQVDITDMASIKSMYETIGDIDAVVLATGKVKFHAFQQMSSADYLIGINSKLMGQVNAVQMGLQYINDGGSFTLTSGILNRDPIQYGCSAAMVNGAIDGYVKSAAIEMPRGIRINAVSPTVIKESMDDYAPYFRGYMPVSAARAAMSYCKSVEGLQTGQVYAVHVN